jgi:hypothetical protein
MFESDPTDIRSFGFATFDPVARPQRRAAAPAARKTARPAKAAPAPAPVVEDLAPSAEPAELVLLRAELAALRAEVTAIREAPAIEARRRALADVWLADRLYHGATR